MSLLRTAVGVVSGTLLTLAVLVLAFGVRAEGLALAAVGWAGNDYLVVAVAGVVAALLVALLGTVRLVRGLDQATPPDPEGVPTGHRLGAEFDELTDGSIRSRLAVSASSSRRERLRERLRETAVQTVMRVDNCPRSVAAERVERGEWTDDGTAARFLRSGGGPSAGGQEYQAAARATALAIDDYPAGEATGDEGAPSAGGSGGTGDGPGATGEGTSTGVEAATDGGGTP